MKLNYDPNAAIAQIMAKVQQVQNLLPLGTQAPVINETVGDTTALMYLAFYSKTLSQQQVNDYVLRVAQPKVQGVAGVGQAQIVPAGTGADGNSFVMRVWLDPDRLAALHLTPADVQQALVGEQFHQRGGTNPVQQCHAHHHRQNLARGRAAIPRPGSQAQRQ